MLEQPHLARHHLPHTSSMPLDKQSNGKALTPALSSNFRNVKSPLTPRLAGSAPNSPASSTRRDAFVRNRSPARDDGVAPTLNGNVTPRTAARRSRIGTESPATPGSNKQTTNPRPRAVSGAAARQPGLGITSNERVNSPASSLQQSIPSPTPVYTVHRRASGARSAVQGHGEGDSRFFHADEVKSSVSERPAQPSEASSFFFVGSPDSQRSQLSQLSPNHETQSSIEEKFFHASDIRPTTNPKPASRPPMPARGFPSTTPARIPYIDTTQSKSTSRPTSPHKANPPPGQSRSPLKETGWKVATPANSTGQNIDRRGSIGSNVSNLKAESRTAHRKSLSTSSINASPPRKQSSPRLLALPTLDQRLAGPLNASSLSLDKAVMSPASAHSFSLQPLETKPLGVLDDMSETQPASASPIVQPALISPGSEVSLENSQSALSKPEHHATNARRERKVLDLEISNSSLLAINKTLERELRKQSVELRRFRRLSRSGRLSIVPTNRSISGSTLDTVAEFDDDENGGSEPEDDSDLDTIDDEDVLSNDSSSVHSPTSRARQRARDEKRLMLDLSKHQQMLLDTQKLTQSIRRCLTCTEDLIKEGNKALEYKVGIGDVHLGGRVLNHEDRDVDGKTSDSSDNEAKERKGLLSPSVMMSQLEEAALWFTNGVGPGQSVETPLNEATSEIDGYLTQPGIGA